MENRMIPVPGGYIALDEEVKVCPYFLGLPHGCPTPWDRIRA